jgi:hypothetical protein
MVAFYIDMDPICFLSDGTIVVTFVTRNPGATLTHRDDNADSSAALELHAFFVDPSNGQLKVTQEWPTTHYGSRIIPGTAGNFIVITPDAFFLYSSERQLLKKLELSLTQRSRGTWNVLTSPDGQKTLVGYSLGSPNPQMQSEEPRKLTIPETSEQARAINVEILWIDNEDLRISHTWTEHGDAWPSMKAATAISNHDIAGASNDKIRDLDGSWHDLCELKYRKYCSFEQFINNDLLLAHSSNRISLIGIDGRVISYWDFAEKETFGRSYSRYAARPSMNGNRFVLPANKGSGGSSFLDIAPQYSLDRILAYDVPSQKWFYQIEGKSHKITSLSGLALSPDGLLMTLITQEGVLEAYRLPKEVGYMTIKP